jgi:hypothetical protein
MKHIATILLFFVLALSALTVTSCRAFTKADAQSLGTRIASSSLAVATRLLAGEKLDLQREVSLIGLQAASSAVATVTYNLASTPAATPQSIVSASHDAAQAAITAAAVPDPAITAKAAEIATEAITVAQDRLNGTDPAPSGK